MSQISLNQHGSGLGLSICKKLVNALGGDIKIDSHLGEGTVTCFSIKCHYWLMADSTDANVEEFNFLETKCF